MQWPCNDAAPDGHADHARRRVRPRQGPLRADRRTMPTEERANRKFPLLLTTGRILSQYNVGAQTRRTENIRWHRTRTCWRSIRPTPSCAASTTATWSRWPEPHGRDHAAGHDQRAGRARASSTPPSTIPTPAPTWSPPSSPTGPPNCPEYKVTAVEVRPANHRSTWQDGFAARAATQARMLPVVE